MSLISEQAWLKHAMANHRMVVQTLQLPAHADESIAHAEMGAKEQEGKKSK